MKISNQKQAVLTSLLAGSFMLSTVGCTAQQIAAATDAAKQILAELKTGNSAELDLDLVDENGEEQALAQDEVESVMVDGQETPFTFDENGNIKLENFSFENDVEVEAEIKLKGVDEPAVIVIAPNGQARNAIKQKAKISFAKANGKRVLLQERIKTFRADLDPLVEAKKKSMKIKFGALQDKLKGKKIVAMYLDGARLPQSDVWIDEDGSVLMHVGLAKRILFNARHNFKKAKAKAKNVSIRTAQFEKKKAKMRKKILDKKSRFVRRRVVTKTVVKTKTITKTFQTAQLRKKVDINIDVNATLTKLNPEQKKKVDARKAQLKKNKQKLRAKRQKFQEKAGKALIAGAKKVRGKEINFRKAGKLRGQAAAHLAKEGVFINRTLYVVAKGQDGKLCVFKMNLTAERLQQLAEKLKARIQRAKARAQQARDKFKQEAQDHANDLDNFLEEQAALADEDEAIVAEGEIELEAEAEDIDADSEAEVEEAADLAEVEEIIEAEEIEEELEAELQDELAAEVEEAGETLAEGEEVELDIDVADVDELEAEDPELTDEVTTEVVDEDATDLDAELAEAEEEAEEAEEEIDEQEAEELALEESVEEGDVEETELEDTDA